MANKVYGTLETAITIGSNSNTVLFTPKNVGTGAGRLSAEWDRGAGAAASRYLMLAFSKSGSTMTIGRAIRQYMTQHDGAKRPGTQGGSDAGFATETLISSGWTPLKPIVAHITTSSTVIVASQVITIVGRYVQFAWWNDLSVTLTNTDADHGLILIPAPPEVQ